MKIRICYFQQFFLHEIAHRFPLISTEHEIQEFASRIGKVRISSGLIDNNN